MSLKRAPKRKRICHGKSFIALACRFSLKYDIDNISKCWVWNGSTSGRYGYGKFHLAATPKMLAVLAHRFSYVIHVGPIEEGLEIDHLCRNKLCVNPDHLEAVTHRENITRANMSERMRMRNLAQPPEERRRRAMVASLAAAAKKRALKLAST